MPTLAGQCVPASGSFPIADAADVKGGCMQVADTTARNAINSSRRTEGMLVWSIADLTMYQLAGGITNSDWATFSGGSKISQGTAAPEGSVTGNTNDMYHQISGGILQRSYIKTTNGGNTGWV